MKKFINYTLNVDTASDMLQSTQFVKKSLDNSYVVFVEGASVRYKSIQFAVDIFLKTTSRSIFIYLSFIQFFNQRKQETLCSFLSHLFMSFVWTIWFYVNEVNFRPFHHLENTFLFFFSQPFFQGLFYTYFQLFLIFFPPLWFSINMLHAYSCFCISEWYRADIPCNIIWSIMESVLYALVELFRPVERTLLHRYTFALYFIWMYMAFIATFICNWQLILSIIDS